MWSNFHTATIKIATMRIFLNWGLFFLGHPVLVEDFVCPDGTHNTPLQMPEVD